MKLKIFKCQSKQTAIFRVFVCSFALTCIAVLVGVSISDSIEKGMIDELIKSVGLMMS